MGALLAGDGALRKSGKAANLDVRSTFWLMDKLFERKFLDGQHLAESLQVILDCGARLPGVECETRIEAWSGKIEICEAPKALAPRKMAL